MNTNPYQSPATISLAKPGPSLGSLPRVDGECLVVASGTVLPPVCIKTNHPVSENDLVCKKFQWCPPWVAICLVLSGLLLIAVYFLARKNCLLTFGLDSHLRKKYRRQMRLKVVAVPALFLAIPLSIAIDDTVAPMIMAVLFIGAVVACFIGNSSLTVVRYHKGLFWIKGASKEFLAGMEQYSGE